MKVRILQRFLESLLLPLEASGASAQPVAGLRQACQGMGQFGDKDVGEFAEFLTRAAGYEREGKWPSSNPPIAGRILDEPSVQDYAQRLRTYLAREVPPGSALTEEVRGEMDRLTKRLKPQQIKEMARELQVEDSFRSGKQGIEKIVLRLTGQSLGGKTTIASSRSKAARSDPAAMQQYAAELRGLAGSDRLGQRLDELVQDLSKAAVQELGESLGATGKARTTKAEWTQLIRAALEASPSGEAATPPGPGMGERPAGESKVERLAEIISALKAKADGPDAPHDEIEAELRSVEEQMDRDEAIAVAKRIGIVRHLGSRNDAVEEIRRKVFEMKRARESIAY